MSLNYNVLRVKASSSIMAATYNQIAEAYANNISIILKQEPSPLPVSAGDSADNDFGILSSLAIVENDGSNVYVVVFNTWAGATLTYVAADPDAYMTDSI